MSDLLTECQAARRLGIATITLRLWRRAGKGPKYVQLGRTIRYTSEAISEYVAAKER
jgi:predicted site-specific integrase-resolvase